MPISKVQSKMLPVSGVPTLAFDMDNTSGNVLIVVVGGAFDIGTPISFSYSDSLGNTAAVETQQYINANVTSQMFFVLDCKGGPNTVSIDTGGLPVTTLVIHEFTQINTLDQHAAAVGTGLSQDSGPITTTKMDELLFGYEFALGQTSVTPADGTWTTAETYATCFLTQYKVVSSTGTYNSTTTTTAGKSGVVNWVEEIISFYNVPLGNALNQIIEF